jgi:transcriptional regulator GlxA family with amidase domain
VTSARVDEARRLLETSQLPIDRVAEAAGFGSVGALRHHFRRRVRLTPSEYRERFGQA